MNIILYGLGQDGKKILNFLVQNGLANLVEGICDREAQSYGGQYKGKWVRNFNQTLQFNVPYVITSSKYKDEITTILRNRDVRFFRSIWDYFYATGVGKGLTLDSYDISTMPIDASVYLKKNEKFHDLHKGKRCFIFGNGPSLKSIDFKLFRDEIVFGCNFLNLVDGYEEAHPDYWLVMADNAFRKYDGSMKKEESEFLEMYEAIHRTSSKLFIPYEAKEYIEDYNLNSYMDINYIYRGSGVNISKKINYDITKPMTSFTNVINYAIAFAIYMGITEIYLLGCEGTLVMGTVNAMLEQKSAYQLHGYDDFKDIAFEVSRNYYMSHGISEEFMSEYIMLEGYRIEAQTCSRLGIKLRNCTPKTIINYIPKVNLSSII